MCHIASHHIASHRILFFTNVPNCITWDRGAEPCEGLSGGIFWLGSTRDPLLDCSHTARVREVLSPEGLGDRDEGWGMGVGKAGLRCSHIRLGLAVRRPDVFLKETNTTAVQPRLLKYGQESSPNNGNDQLVAVNTSFKDSMVVL